MRECGRGAPTRIASRQIIIAELLSPRESPNHSVRCASLAIVVTAQFIIFDGLRGLLAVAPSDLSLILDVFQATNQFLIATSSPPHLYLYQAPSRPYLLTHMRRRTV